MLCRFGPMPHEAREFVFAHSSKRRPEDRHPVTLTEFACRRRIIGQHRLERLLGLPFRVLRRQRMDAFERKHRLPVADAPPTECHLGQTWRSGLPAGQSPCSTDRWLHGRSPGSPVWLAHRSTMQALSSGPVPRGMALPRMRLLLRQVVSIGDYWRLHASHVSVALG
jgi:hypothetical protein